MTFNPIPRYFPATRSPYSRIQPFTYRDGRTFLEFLTEMSQYITAVLVPEVDERLETITNSFDAAMSELSTAVDAAEQAAESAEHSESEVVRLEGIVAENLVSTQEILDEMTTILSTLDDRTAELVIGETLTNTAIEDVILAVADANTAMFINIPSNSRDAVDTRINVRVESEVASAVASSTVVKDAAVAAMMGEAVQNRLSWNKPRITSGSVDELFGAANQGIHPLASAVTGGPRAGGIVEVIHDGGTGLTVQVWRHSLSTVTSVYRRSGNASGWGTWVSENWQGAEVPSGFDFNTELNANYREVVTGSTVNGPAGFGIGILEVFPYGNGVIQRYTEGTTGRVAYRRASSGVFDEWFVYPTVSSIEAQIQSAIPDEDSETGRGFRSVPLAVTLPGTTQTQTQTQGAVRWSRRWPHKPTRVRLHVSNRNPGNNVHSAAVNITGARIGLGSENGALTNAVEALASSTIPGDGSELIGPWVAVPGTDGDWLTVSIGYESGTEQQLLQGGGWINPAASSHGDATAAGWTYSQETPFYVWLESEVPSSAPVLLVHGDSSVIGTASETPVQDSFAMQYALSEGALPVFFAQHGSTMANWQGNSLRWDAFYPGIQVCADAVLTGIGGNDLGGGADLSVMQSRWAGIREAHEDRWPGVPVYVCNRYASTRPPAVEVVRRSFNSWVETRPFDERWVFDFSGVLSDDEDEALKPEYSADGLHPNRAGHLAVTALLTATPPTPFTLTAAQARSFAS